MSKGKSLLRLFVAFFTCLPLAGISWAAHINTSTHTSSKSKTQQRKVSESQRTRRRMHHLARRRSANLTRASVSTRRRHHYYERFHMSSFAENMPPGTLMAGEIRTD